MASISPSALAALLRGKAEGEMVFVRIKKPNGGDFGGRLMDLLEFSPEPAKSTVTVEATDGEVHWRVPVHRIVYTHVVPFRRFGERVPV